MTERGKYNIYLALLAAALFCAWGAAPWIDSLGEPKPMPTMSVPPLPKQVRCPRWHPGLSRTIVIYVTENADGFDQNSVECVRLRERSMVLPKVTM